MRVVQNNGMIPTIYKDLKKMSTAHIIPISIIKLNSPMVNILRGRAARSKAGLIKKLIMPITIPIAIIYNNFLSEAAVLSLTWGTNSMASQIPRTPAII